MAMYALSSIKPKTRREHRVLNAITTHTHCEITVDIDYHKLLIIPKQMAGNLTFRKQKLYGLVYKIIRHDGALSSHVNNRNKAVSSTLTVIREPSEQRLVNAPEMTA